MAGWVGVEGFTREALLLNDVWAEGVLACGLAVTLCPLSNTLWDFISASISV